MIKTYVIVECRVCAPSPIRDITVNEGHDDYDWLNSSNNIK